MSAFCELRTFSESMIALSDMNANRTRAISVSDRFLERVFEANVLWASEKEQPAKPGARASVEFELVISRPFHFDHASESRAISIRIR